MCIFCVCNISCQNKRYSHKTAIWILLIQPLVAFIYNPPNSHDGRSSCPITPKVRISRPMTLPRGRDLLDVSSCIILIIPWTDLFVVDQDGVPFGKSFQYPSGALHWYVTRCLGRDTAWILMYMSEKCVLYCTVVIYGLATFSMLTSLNEFSTAGKPPLAA